MTVVYLLVSAFIAAWASAGTARNPRPAVRIAYNTIHLTFTAIAIGAGIQLLFRG